MGRRLGRGCRGAEGESLSEGGSGVAHPETRCSAGQGRAEGQQGTNDMQLAGHTQDLAFTGNDGRNKSGIGVEWSQGWRGLRRAPGPGSVPSTAVTAIIKKGQTFTRQEGICLQMLLWGSSRARVTRTQGLKITPHKVAGAHLRKEKPEGRNQGCVSNLK